MGSIALLLAGLVAFSADDIVVPPSLELAPEPECYDHEDCTDEAEPYCHPSFNECRQCVEAVHCDPDFGCSYDGTCVPACTTDDDCTDGAWPRCATDEGICVACLDQSDCGDDEECNAYYECVPFDTCVPGTVTCSGDSVVQCAADGRTLEELERCDGGCIDAMCVGGPGTGGSSTGTSGTPPGTSSTPSGTGDIEPMSGSGSDGAPPAEPIDRGCTCQADAAPGGWALVLILLLVPPRPRRRRR